MEEKLHIKQVLSGDTEAYRFLVERYQVGLIIHCENIVKDRSDAEDIAQDAFIKAFLDLSAFRRDKGRFSTWLYKIATNLCIDWLRKQGRTIRAANTVLSIDLLLKRIAGRHGASI